MPLLFTALLLATQSVAATPQPAPAVAAPVAKKDRTICKSFEDSASRLGKRVCKKESEWAKGVTADDKAGSRSTMTAQPR